MAQENHGTYKRGPVTQEGTRSDFGDHVIIRGTLHIHIPGGLWMADLIKDCGDSSLQQYLLSVKALIKSYFMKVGWSGEGDVRVCDFGGEPTHGWEVSRCTFIAHDALAEKKVYVSLPRDRAEAAIARLGLDDVVGEIN